MILQEIKSLDSFKFRSEHSIFTLCCVQVFAAEMSVHAVDVKHMCDGDRGVFGDEMRTCQFTFPLSKDTDWFDLNASLEIEALHYSKGVFLPTAVYLKVGEYHVSVGWSLFAENREGNAAILVVDDEIVLTEHGVKVLQGIPAKLQGYLAVCASNARLLGSRGGDP